MYKVEPGAGENVKWTLVLEGDASLLPTACVQQSLTESKGVVTAFMEGRRLSGRVLHGDTGVSVQGWGELEAALSVGFVFTRTPEAGRLLPLGY